MALDEEVNRILQEVETERAARQQLEDHLLRSLHLDKPLPEHSTFQDQRLKRDATPPPQSTSVVDIIKATIEGAGAVGGGMRGAGLGARFGPLPALIGGVGGAFLGSAGGRAAFLTGEPLVTGTPPPPLEQQWQEILSSGVEGALGELGGQALLGGRRALGMGTRRLLGGEAKAGDTAIMDQAQRLGITLRPAEVTEGSAASLIERSLRRSLGGRGTFRTQDLKNEQAFSQAIESFADSAWGAAQTAQTTELLIKKTLEGEVIPEGRLVVRGLYKHLNDLTEGKAIVETPQLLQAVQLMKQSLDPKIQPKSVALLEHLEEQLTKPGPLGGFRVRKTADVPGALNVKTTAAGPIEARSLPFLTAHEIRSQLLSISRQGEPLPELVHSRAREAASYLDGTMAQAALLHEQATGKPVSQVWRAANQASKDLHELAETGIITRALRDDPKGLYNTTLKKGAIRDVQALRESLQNNPAVWRTYQRGALEEYLERAKTGGEGYISGDVFANQFNKVGETVNKAIFGEQYATIQRFATIAKKMDSRATRSGSEGPGLLWTDIGMLMSIPTSAGFSAGTGNVWPLISSTATVATYLLGERYLARVLNDPIKSKLLLEAVESAQTGKWGLYTRAMTNLSTQTMTELASP